MLAGLPGFILDDYYIFHVITQNPSHPVSYNPAEYYFLFMRPVTYFSHWLDQTIFHFSSLLMKAEGMLLHLLLISVFYFFIKNLTQYLKIETKPLVLALVTLIFSLHTVFVWQIVWLAQRNELLMLLFYIIACYMVLLYLTKHDKYYLWMFLLCYILSVSSKQQAMHLPLILLFISIFFRKKFSAAEYKDLFRFSLAGIVLMLIFFVLNTILYQDYGAASLFANIWKKPLSVAATFLIALAPYETEKLYTYFLTHKIFAVVLFVIALIVLFFYRAKIKPAIPFAVVFILSFLPSAFAETSLRIIGIQVFLVFAFIPLAPRQTDGGSSTFKGGNRETKTRSYPPVEGAGNPLHYILLVVLLGLNVHASLKQYSDEFALNEFRNDYLTKLDEHIKLNPLTTDIFIAVAPYSIMLPYQFYYFKYGKFGKYPIAISPAGYSYYYKNFTSGELNNPSVPEGRQADTLAEAELNNNIVTVTSKREYISNYILMNIPDFNEFEITEKVPDKIRGYTQLSFKLPEKYSGYEKIYYNGIAWLTLTDPHILKENMKPGLTNK
jgi:hypothetical protein